MNLRPYFLWYDATTNVTLPLQGDNPLNDEMLPIGVVNRRQILDPNAQTFFVGDLTVHPRGAKTTVWSSEGYALNGIPISPITAAQKIATNSSATTITTSLSLPAGITLPTNLNVAPFHSLSIMIVLSALTGTSIQFEYDVLDDSGNSVALWKSAALTAAGSLLTTIMADSTAAPSAPSGWTFTNVAMLPGMMGRLSWTASAVTAATWTAYVYGNTI